jgi:hypothetical protein
MMPRLPLATPSWAMALRPHTTRSPTASWRSSTWSRSGPRWPWAASSSWQAVLSRSTSARRAANTITSWAGSWSACCQAAHQSCSRARVAAGLESAATTRSWAW